MEALFLKPAGAGRSYRIWPDPEPIPEGAVQEAVDHTVELRGSPWAQTAELAVEGVRLTPLRTADPACARWVWAPGFHAGRADATLALGGRRVNMTVTVDAARRKASRDEFDGMVGEILRDTLALLAAGGFRTGMAAGSGARVPPLARLEYLRSRAEAVCAVVTAIDARPRRTLVADDQSLPYWQARTATGAEIVKSLRSGRLLKDRNDPPALPAPLRGHLPSTIRRQVRRSSLDIPEHRAIKGCLTLWSGWLGAMADLAAGSALGDEEAATRRAGWAARLRAASRELSALLRLPLLEGVREGEPRPEATPLFRNDPAYREFLRLARDMELGMSPVFGDFLDMPIARTYDLYELWVFLRLASGVGLLAGTKPTVSGLFRQSASGIDFVRGAASVSAGPLTVHFQRPFGEFWRAADGLGSMSHEMTPDVVLSAAGTQGIVALDAKYRVGAGVSDALSSAHMYRDAIVAAAGGGTSQPVVGSYVVSPHAPGLGDDWSTTAMPDRFFHPGYRADFHFGAVSLRPGMDDAEVAAVLRELAAPLGVPSWPTA